MKTIIVEIMLCFLMCLTVHVLDHKFKLTEQILSVLEIE